MSSDDDDGVHNEESNHIDSRKRYAQGSHLQPNIFTLGPSASSKTKRRKTEKIFVTNLPPKEPADTPGTDESSNILDILNSDCLTHILTYVPIADLARSERVSKRWQSMVLVYLQGIRPFRTSWWGERATPEVLRGVLRRVGGALSCLHVDHTTRISDSIVGILGEFCPNLEELELKDSDLTQTVKPDSCIESLSFENCPLVTGDFLLGSKPRQLHSLSFRRCASLQGTVLCAAMDTLPHLTTLKLDEVPDSTGNVVPMILKKLPHLRELSLCRFYSSRGLSVERIAPFCESLANLTELRVLDLSSNEYVGNAVLEQIAQSCTELESLTISGCNGSEGYGGDDAVSNKGVKAICTSCRSLSYLDVSNLVELRDAGLRAAACLPRLTTLISGSNSNLSSAPFAAAIAACHTLQVVDARVCESVCDKVVRAAVRALESHPRPLTLRLYDTLAKFARRLPTHKLLTVDMKY